MAVVDVAIKNNLFLATSIKAGAWCSGPVRSFYRSTQQKEREISTLHPKAKNVCSLFIKTLVVLMVYLMSTNEDRFKCKQWSTKTLGDLPSDLSKTEELRGGRKDRRLYTVAILDCYICR